MKVRYLPNLGIEIQSEDILWNESRHSVRIKLKQSHKEDDMEIDNSEFFDGDKSFNIHQRRDIYEDIENGKNLFFFSYDHDDKLREIEFHVGINLSVGNSKIEIGEDISEVIERLKYSHTEIDKGNYFFSELKLNLANDEFMGGDGNGLSYIYVTKDDLESE